tara:strand:- start:17206 stop:17505 length:300 start_codon:yes stop_codon:yes gene_type:complete
MKTANEHAHEDYEALKETIEKLTADVATLSDSLAEALKESAGRAANDIRDGVKSAAADISDKGKASQEAIEQTVRERPFQSLLAAFSVGLLIALLFRKH